MAPWRRRTACDRAALWISLELDGEISELERAALAAHLGGCAECSSVQAEIAGFTRLMRDAPVEAPRVDGAVLTRLPVRLRPARRRVIFALAAAIATSLTVLALAKPPGTRPPTVNASATFSQSAELASADHAWIYEQLLAPSDQGSAQLVVPPQIRRL
jgi:ferric-dicitrate binding protein FerR (iron transport regulator)